MHEPQNVSNTTELIRLLEENKRLSEHINLLAQQNQILYDMFQQQQTTTQELLNQYRSDINMLNENHDLLSMNKRIIEQKLDNARNTISYLKHETLELKKQVLEQQVNLALAERLTKTEYDQVEELLKNLDDSDNFLSKK